MTSFPAKASWSCNTCNAAGMVTGVVGVSRTPSEPNDAEFYPEKDRDSGYYFAGCIRCGSEDVVIEDVRSD